MKKYIVLAAVGASLLPLNSYASNSEIEALSKKIDELQKELEFVKRKQEVDSDIKKSNEEKFATVEYGSTGLKVNTPDKRGYLRVRGYAQVDNRTFFDDSKIDNIDQFLVRTARPIIEGGFDKDFYGRIMLDFGGGNTRLVDAYADYKAFPIANIRLGKFKSPIGLERWQGEQDLEFVERGLATNLVPFRDIGLQLSGEILPQTLEYQLAYTNGTTDLGDSNSDIEDAKDFYGRIFSHPFRNSSIVALQGLGLGFAASTGSHEGSTSSTGLTDGYRTIAQQRFFTYQAGTLPADTAFADGGVTRLNPQAYFYYGPFGALAEYVNTKQELKRGTTKKELEHDAITAEVSYVLTGEDASFEGVKPAENFSFDKGGKGAWELTGRYSEINLDDESFPTFSDPTKSAKSAQDKTVGVNWYVNPNLKFNVNYSQTDFEGGSTGGSDRDTEKALLTRAQFKF